MNKQKYILLYLLLFLPLAMQAQILHPIKWQTNTSKKEVKIGETLELIFTADVEKDWYLYSSDFSKDLGPMVTVFKFEPNATYALVGGLRAINPKKKYDDLWGGEYTYFKGKAEFRQKIKVLKANPKILATVDYQVCTDKDGKCIPLDEEFSFTNIKIAKAGAVTSTADKKAAEKKRQEEKKKAAALKKKKEDEAKAKAATLKKKKDDKAKAAALKKKKEAEAAALKKKKDDKVKAAALKRKKERDELLKKEKNEKVRAALLKEQEEDDAKAELLRKEQEEEDAKAELLRKEQEEEEEAERLKEEQKLKEESEALREEENKTENTDNTTDSGDDSQNNNEKEGDSEESQSILTFMLLSFLGGLAALLTPCVFPIIPMTVSFFTSKADNRSQAIRQGLLYGVSIVAIYTLIGVLVSSVFGPEAANVLATHWLPNLLFFAIFLIFAISFFGAFEIVLPSSWVNSMDKKADKGGIAGIFFMALTLVVISFSCTGPIAGSILIASANGDVLMPMLGMFAFSMAFAIPFSLFAIFPAWLSSLPKSGGWLNTVKVVLGFIELALAFKFLSVADQVYHWGLLDRDIYITIWVAIGIAMSLYLVGLIRLPHDSPSDKIGVGRLLFAILTLSFVVYLIPGLFGAPLKGLAGYLPPQSTLDFDINRIVRDNIKAASFKGSATTKTADTSKRKYADLFHLPHGLEGYFDLEEAMAASKRENKPVFIDFTGHGCVNCREMEAAVWVDPGVLKRLSQDYILLALYVDDPTPLPENEWVKAKDGKTKKTIGKVNANYQIERFVNNAQPYYVLLDSEGEMLIKKPKAYDLNPQHFIEYLDKGLEEFKKK